MAKLEEVKPGVSSAGFGLGSGLQFVVLAIGVGESSFRRWGQEPQRFCCPK